MVKIQNISLGFVRSNKNSSRILRFVLEKIILKLLKVSGLSKLSTIIIIIFYFK